MVQIGDTLKGSGDGPVTQISKVTRRGVYAPAFTTSGTIVVNGVAASTYIALQASPTLKIGSMSTQVSFQDLAHTFGAPHRLYCRLFSSCKNEKVACPGGCTPLFSLQAGSLPAK